MNRIDRRFRELKKRSQKAFIAYITAGDPNLAMTKKLVLELEGSGVDIIELGIPFSDPMADGPTIQAASQRALSGGASVRKIFGAVRDLRMKTRIPLVFMTYYNPVLRFGVEKFIGMCRKAGIDGIIVPDLPCEESSALVRAARSAGVAAIFLVAPTSTPARMKMIAKRSRGFIYYVSLTGVTGARTALPSDIAMNLKKLKRLTGKPVAVGFGVSTPGQAAALARHADGIIVGSAIVKIVGEKKDVVARVSKFAMKMAKAIHNA